MDAGGCIDRELAYFNYRFDRLGIGRKAMKLSKRLARLVSDLGRVYPVTGDRLPWSDWVHFNGASCFASPRHVQFKQHWYQLTGRKALLGYNFRGIGYAVQQELDGYDSDATVIIGAEDM